MLSFFELKPTNSGILVDGELLTISARQKATVDKMVDYQFNNPVYVKSDNILVSALMGLPSMDNTNMMDYYDTMQSVEIEIANSLGISNSSKVGMVRENHILNCTEVFVLDRDRLSFKDIMAINNESWANLSPLKPLRLPSDMPSTQQFGSVSNNDSRSKGIAVYSVNIAVLGLMYYQYGAMMAEMPESLTVTPEEFIGRYVYGNAMRYSTNLKVITILNSLKDKTEPVFLKSNNDTYVLDHVPKTIVRWSKILEDLTARGDDLTDILRSCPTFGKESLAEVLPYFEDVLTSNNYWVSMLVVGPYLELVSYILTEAENTTNIRNTVARFLRYIKGNNIISKVDDAVVTNELYRIKDIMEKIKT